MLEYINSVLGYFVAIITVINPFGTIPVFVSLTEGDSRGVILKTIKKACFFMFIILASSFFFGAYIIQFFGIHIYSLRMAGGLIIISSGFSLLTGRFSRHKGLSKEVQYEAMEKSDISMTPLAMPMLAGPGCISLLIGMNENVQSNYWGMLSIFIAIFLASVSVYFILRTSGVISKFMGASGLNALSRIIGFLIIAIGIEYIVSSLKSIVQLFL